MKAPITRDELKRRMLECGGISSDDAENAAVMELFDEIDRLRAGKPKPQGKTVLAQWRMPKLTLKGRIDITRPTRNDGVERVEITLGDVDACSEVLTIHMELADFARALTGLGRVPCEIETSSEQLERVGTKHESKTEFVTDVGETSLLPFCVHGWRPRSGDFGNHHRWWVQDGKKGYAVSFFRNVKKEPDVAVTPDENATSGGRG